MEEQESNIGTLERAVQKSRELGWFALTAQDHRDMNSTPDSILEKGEGKAMYELLSEEEVIFMLDTAEATFSDPELIANGYANEQREFLRVSLLFLGSVGRLPKKYKNY